MINRIAMVTMRRVLNRSSSSSHWYNMKLMTLHRTLTNRVKKWFSRARGIKVRKTITRFYKSEIAKILLLIITVKCLLFVASLIAVPVFDGKIQTNSALLSLEEVWHRWDAPHYTNIARNWYTGTGDKNLIAFFPLYPLVIRVVAPFVGYDYVLSAILIANICSVFALILFYYLARIDYSKEEAWWATIMFLLFPTAYFLNAPYTEGLFLALAISSLYLARKGQWWGAGLAAGLSTMARITGLALFPALCVEFFMQWRVKKVSLDRLASLVFIPIGFSAYLLANIQLFGRPFAFMDVQREHWYKSLAWPWIGLRTAWRWIDSPLSANGLMLGIAEFMAAIILIGVCIWSWRRLRPSYAVYTLFASFMVISSTFLMSTPRYMLSVFPAFFIFTSLGRRPTVRLVWVTCSVLLLSLFLSRFARGVWAF